MASCCKAARAETVGLTLQFGFEITYRLKFLKFLGGRARLLFKQGGPSPTVPMSKALLVFSDLELPMIVHGGSNRPYFA
jgi:hypothetical protein